MNTQRLAEENIGKDLANLPDCVIQAGALRREGDHKIFVLNHCPYHNHLCHLRSIIQSAHTLQQPLFCSLH
jgi:hypothetical protein